MSTVPGPKSARYWIGVASRDPLTSGKPSWGAVFRRGLVEVSADDFSRIATAMGVTVASR